MLRVTSKRPSRRAAAQIMASGNLTRCSRRNSTARSAIGLSRSTIVKPGEKGARHCGCSLARTDHDLHPCNNADGGIIVPRQLVARLRPALQEINQDIGVEEGLHHSARTLR